VPTPTPTPAPTPTPSPAPAAACGSANGQTLSSIPTTNLCSAGTASTVTDTGAGSWAWTCLSSGGTNAACYALQGSTPPSSGGAPSISVTIPGEETGKTYYVDSSTGSDGNNGLSLTTAFATIGHAASVTNPGDLVEIRAGNGYSGGLNLGNSGTSSAYITFEGYPGDSAPVITVGGASYGIDVTGNYIAVVGLNVQGSQSDQAAGIQVSSNNINAPNHHIIILDNTVGNVGAGGISTVYADYLTIDGNTVYGTSNSSPFGTSGISIWAAQNSDNSTATKMFVVGNLVYDNVEKVIETACGGICDGEGIIIDDNSNSQTNNIQYTGGTLVANNIAYGNGSNGIQVGNSSNVTVIYNTLYENGVSGVAKAELAVLNGGSGNVIENNIIYAGPGNSAGNQYGTAATWDYNDMYNGTLTGGTDGSHTIYADPMFVNPTSNFQLQPGSPAIGAANSAYTISTDFAGNPRPTSGGYDIGAYQE
jgi:hypothetical protein